MSKKYIGKICPYCKTPFVKGDTVVFCSVCDMPHHLSCWQDNQGCTTFGCTGSIKEIVGTENKAEAAPPATTPKTVSTTSTTPTSVKTEQTEKPIETLYESKEMAFMSEVPLVLENTALIIDRTKDKLFARCTFRSITDKAIKAILIELSCQDVWGSTLGEPITFQYLDLKTKRESKFGQTNPIELLDKNTRKFNVFVKKILFEDGTVVAGGGVSFTMPAPTTLVQYLKSKDLANEYVRETTPKAQYVPEQTDSIWRCTCGSLNNITDANCHHCGCSKELQQVALNPEMLNANMMKLREERRIAEEKAKAEQAERIRIAEEQVRLERERKEQEILEAEQAKQANRKRIRKRVAIIASVLVLFLIGCGVIIWGVPYIQYQTACTALENKQYDKAIEIFAKLGDYENSQALLDDAKIGKENEVKEARYQDGIKALEGKQYDTAIEIFGELGTYSDSKDKLAEAKRYKENAVKEARYQEGIAALNAAEYDTAIAIFTELGNYAECKTKLAEAEAKKEELAKEARYQEGITALNNKQYDTAITIFTELGSYSDSKAKLTEAQNAVKEVRYQEGITALNNKQYDTAITIFTELGNYSDSKAKLTEAQNKRKEVRYQEGITALNNKQYDTAVTIFTELGSYSDSKAKLTEAKYEHANNLMASKKYEAAYKLLKDVGNYGDAQSKITTCLYAWADSVAASSKKSDAENFKATVTLSAEHYSTIYAKIWNRINSHSDFDYWDDYWNDTQNAAVVYAMLQTLPSSYEETANLCKLFKVLVNGDIHPVADYIRSNQSFIKSVWHIGFIQDFVASDEMICYFLEDYWSTYDGTYYMSFYENYEGGTTCDYNLPWVDEPYGTVYFNIVGLTYIFEDDYGNELAKVYKFTIINFDTIKVYCYEDNNTYTLYRQ